MKHVVIKQGLRCSGQVLLLLFQSGQRSAVNNILTGIRLQFCLDLFRFKPVLRVIKNLINNFQPEFTNKKITLGFCGVTFG